MNLTEYLNRHGISQAEFGALYSPPASQSLVSQWCKGVTRMTLQRALETVRLTAGEVSAEDCAAMFNGRTIDPEPAASIRPSGALT